MARYFGSVGFENRPVDAVTPLKMNDDETGCNQTNCFARCFLKILCFEVKL